MSHAAEQRYTAAGEETKLQSIKATDEWLEALKQLPFKSCKYILPASLIYVIYAAEKNGKTLYLLKQSAKVHEGTKKRKVVPLLGTIKEYHVAHQSQMSSSQSSLVGNQGGVDQANQD